MYICIDFDGTLVDHAYPEIGAPVPRALDYLRRWQALDASLILFTMRSDGKADGSMLSQAVEYLSDNGISLYGINSNPTQHAWTGSPKAFANLYIDDAAFGCPLWHPAGFRRPCVDWSIVGPVVEKQLLAIHHERQS